MGGTIEDGEGNGGSLIPYSMLGMGCNPCNSYLSLSSPLSRSMHDEQLCFPIEPFRAKQDDENGQDAKRG
jgi:hypothetical protein